jgi:hypothetical protein
MGFVQCNEDWGSLHESCSNSYFSTVSSTIFSGIFQPFRNSQLSVWIISKASMGQQVFVFAIMDYKCVSEADASVTQSFWIHPILQPWVHYLLTWPVHMLLGTRRCFCYHWHIREQKWTCWTPASTIRVLQLCHNSLLDGPVGHVLAMGRRFYFHWGIKEQWNYWSAMLEASWLCQKWLKVQDGVTMWWYADDLTRFEGKPHFRRRGMSCTSCQLGLLRTGLRNGLVLAAIKIQSVFQERASNRTRT